MAAEHGTRRGWYDVSTLREPYRIEGKKSMGYELAEQLDWQLPDWILYPTGGGTGLIGMWKAFDEMEAIGWIPTGRRPRMVCGAGLGLRAHRPRVRHDGGTSAPLWEDAHTVADGLRVPRAIGDFLMLRILRASGGTGVCVDDADMVSDMLAMGTEGISAAPEGAATLSAARRLVADGRIQPDETVVLFNTAGALKYLDVLAR